MDRSDMSPWELEERDSPASGAVAEPDWEPNWLTEPDWLTDPGPERPVRAAAGAPGDGTPPQRLSWLRTRREGVLAVVAAVVVVAAVAVTGFVLRTADPETTSVAVVSDEPVESAPVVDDTWCTDLGAGTPASLDSDDPGEAAIAAFEHAYYVLREGARAREHVTADARVGSAEQIGRGIEQIPVGTTHCVLVKKATDGAYAVDVFERRPDGTTEHYPQTVLTVHTPDGARITAITPRD